MTDKKSKAVYESMRDKPWTRYVLCSVNYVYNDNTYDLQDGIGGLVKIYNTSEEAQEAKNEAEKDYRDSLIERRRGEVERYYKGDERKKLMASAPIDALAGYCSECSWSDKKSKCQHKDVAFYEIVEVQQCPE